MNLAHEQERPPTFGTWFCDCHGCRIAAQALARTEPGAHVVLKFDRAARLRIPIGQWVEAGCDVTEFTLPGDRVREVFIGAAR